MACSDVGGRVTDGADSPAAAGSSDRAQAFALQLLAGWRRLRMQTWMALAVAQRRCGVAHSSGQGPDRAPDLIGAYGRRTLNTNHVPFASFRAASSAATSESDLVCA